MLHLLTEEQKEKVSAEYSKRVWVIISFGIIVVVVISTAFLIPVYLTSYSRYAEASRDKAQLEAKIASSQDASAAQSVSEITATLAVLDEYKTASIPSRIIESVVTRRPNGIRLNHFSYSPNGTDPASLDVSGKANTRTDLVTFSNSLRTDPDFSSVLIPISNFAREKSIDFTVKLVVSTSTRAAAAAINQ